MTRDQIQTVLDALQGYQPYAQVGTQVRQKTDESIAILQAALARVDKPLEPSAAVFELGGLSVPTAYALLGQQVVLQHPLLNDPAVMVFLRANPYADKQAMRLIYEEIASAFSGATLTCTSAADMDTGKWHLYLDVDTHGELDMDAQIQREMVLHSTFLQNQQLHRAKEYFHVTVS